MINVNKPIELGWMPWNGSNTWRQSNVVYSIKGLQSVQCCEFHRGINILVKNNDKRIRHRTR